MAPCACCVNLYVRMYKVIILGVFQYFYHCITLLVFSCLFTLISNGGFSSHSIRSMRPMRGGFISRSRGPLQKVCHDPARMCLVTTASRGRKRSVSPEEDRMNKTKRFHGWMAVQVEPTQSEPPTRFPSRLNTAKKTLQCFDELKTSKNKVHGHGLIATVRVYRLRTFLVTN
jgi:hypothetical protein